MVKSYPEIERQMSEYEIQTQIVNYIKREYPDALFTANAAGLRTSWKQASRMKAMGGKAGVPDLAIYEARGKHHAFFIELKRSKGYLRLEQKIWIEELGKRGYKAICCRGFLETKNAIDEYFKL